MHKFNSFYALVITIERSRLKKAIIDQREEITSSYARMKVIERDCFEKYKPHLASSQIKIIMGVRRSGKSVLSYQLLKDKPFAYINFDDERLVNLVADDLNDVLEVFYEVYGNVQFILLDEIQNIPGWELFVNRLQRHGFNVMVTGSNAHLLSRELSTHLTGRHIALNLFPFSFREFLRYHSVELKNAGMLSSKDRGLLKKKLDEYITLGGFPEVSKDPANKRAYLQSLYSDIVDKDIVIRHKIKFSKTLKEIASSLMSYTASHISFNKIKNMFGLKSVHTALNYLSFMEESFLFFLVPRFSFKAKERAIATRKIYSVDTGMIDSLGVSFSQNRGKLYENMVFLELARRNPMERPEIYYWQDISQNEVDFVVRQGRKINELIQVCYDVGNYDTKKREVMGLVKASKELQCGKLTVTTDDYEAEETLCGRKITFVPLWKWLLH